MWVATEAKETYSLRRQDDRHAEVILDLCQGNQQWPSMFRLNKAVGCVIAVRLC